MSSDSSARPEPRLPALPGYSSMELIGRGGFSSVYKAHQDALGRDVAVKILLADMTNEQEERRFRRECTVLGKLGSHPNIIDVYDAGITPGHRPYIVMKYYSGGNLADRLRTSGPVAATDAIDIIRQTAAALDYAHSLGVIHRDIKPDNILVDDEGRPILTDFGVAAIAESAGNYTTSVAFSPAHAAPEVLDNNEYGVASDVYSLASTLYTLLTAKPAFAAKTEARRISAITTQPPPPIAVDGVPAALDKQVRTAMAKIPSERPATPGVFADTLQGSLTIKTYQEPAPANDSRPDLAQHSGAVPPDPDDQTRLRPQRTPKRAVRPSVPTPIPAVPQSTRRTGSGGLLVLTFLPTNSDGDDHYGEAIFQVGGFAVGSHAARVFLRPTGVAIMQDGSIVLSDTENNRICRVDDSGRLSTLAGSGIQGFADGEAKAARFNHPTGVAVDPTGGVIVADTKNHRIRYISASGRVSTLAGSGDPWFADGRGVKARFHHPRDVAINRYQAIFVADASNYRIRRLEPDGDVTTIAGDAQSSFANGPGLQARFRYPTGITVAPDGALIVADRGNHRIRRISEDVVTVLAGKGAGGFADGHGSVAKFLNPSAAQARRDGSILVADTGNNRVRSISRKRQVSTVAGTLRHGNSDGNAADASFREPHGIATRPDGSIVVADRWNNGLRMISNG